ncbi:MAG: DUF6605 domain-containing protein [Planctomycetaceae bacterium]|nr:DUF6605 domain-containing protein [Planctomycetaceae bacterium]
MGRLMLAFTFWLSATLGFCADATDPRPLFLEGYAGQVSYAPGDTATLHVSTSAEKFSVEITRLGGTSQVVHKQADLAGVESPIPEHASSHGCGWPALVTLPIPDTWRSGYYQVTLRAADNGGKFVQRNRRTVESSCYFVVRPKSPSQQAKILLQLATNTYNAYNNWGGFSLYAYHGRANVQGHRVSFRRPASSQFANWEQPFAAWAENHGYAIDYCANSDLELHPELLTGYRLVLSVGHDEYWSAPMRDRLEAYIGEGGNVAFFSGNTCCWQVRTEDQGAALVSWKQRFVMDPVFASGDQRLLSTAWSHHLVARPENQLTGVGFLFGGYHRSHGQYMDGPAAFTVHRPDHWLFEGTGLKTGDAFGGKDTIVGYECDGCEFTLKDGLPVPTHRDGTPAGFVIVGSCPARWHPDDSQWYDRFPKDREGAAVFGAYTRGGTVVTVGTTDWAHGLRGKDPHVERITANVLNRLGEPPRSSDR